MTDQAATHPGSHEPKRRDFLMIAATALGGVGAAALVWPFIDQMEPSRDVLAAGGPIDVNLSALKPGQQIVVRWRSRPIFILNRTDKALAKLKQPDELDKLRDPQSEHKQQPEYATNWSRSVKPEFLVIVGICTHLGCIPDLALDASNFNLGASWPGGYFCPCHGSKYDLAGRVFKGVPAPENLPVPPYHFVDDKTLRVGENPEGSNFNFGDIVQI